MTRAETAHDGSTGPAPGSNLSERITWLIASADEIGGDDEQRREPIIERADTCGVERGMAERAYDLAVEERIPAAAALAVVAAGISVQHLESPRPDVNAASSGEPDWVDAPPARDDAELERRLRQTFRRLRSHLEASPSARAAFVEFAREPDLEAFDY